MSGYNSVSLVLAEHEISAISWNIASKHLWKTANVLRAFRDDYIGSINQISVDVLGYPFGLTFVNSKFARSVGHDPDDDADHIGILASVIRPIEVRVAEPDPLSSVENDWPNERHLYPLANRVRRNESE